MLLCSPAIAQVASDTPHADDAEIPCEDVRVHVRTLEGVIGDEEGQANTKQAELALDKRIEDLREKLSKLHYQQYKLLAEKSAVVPIAKRRVLNLSDGHKLTVRPLYANSARIGVWMNWKDSAGMEVLDSRLHFNYQEHVVTALEMNKNRGLLLAIHVSPIRAE